MFDPSTTIATSFLIFLSLWPVVTYVFTSREWMTAKASLPEN